MTLLAMINSIQPQLSLSVSTSVVGNTDDNVVLLLSLAQKEGQDLADRFDWQALTTEKTFTTVASASQTGAIASDFNRFVNDTMFNRSQRRRVVGPISVEEWQSYQALLVTRVNPAFRVRGDAILMTPTPAAGETIAYEYISKNWCTSSGGTGQSAWAADTDIPLLNQETMALGVLWRFLKTKGMEYGEAFTEYERRVANLMLRDGGRQRISTNYISPDRVANAPQMPETLIGF